MFSTTLDWSWLSKICLLRCGPNAFGLRANALLYVIFLLRVKKHNKCITSRDFFQVASSSNDSFRSKLTVMSTSLCVSVMTRVVDVTSVFAISASGLTLLSVDDCSEDISERSRWYYVVNDHIWRPVHHQVNNFPTQWLLFNLRAASNLGKKAHTIHLQT